MIDSVVSCDCLHVCSKLCSGWISDLPGETLTRFLLIVRVHLRFLWHRIAHKENRSWWNKQLSRATATETVGNNWKVLHEMCNTKERMNAFSSCWNKSFPIKRTWNSTGRKRDVENFYVLTLNFMARVAWSGQKSKRGMIFNLSLYHHNSIRLEEKHSPQALIFSEPIMCSTDVSLIQSGNLLKDWTKTSFCSDFLHFPLFTPPHNPHSLFTS